MSEPANPEVKIAHLRYTGDEAFVAVSPSGHAIVTGFAAGDKLASPTPMELLLISLGGCTGADVSSILQKKRQKVTGYEIEVRGQRRDEHPRIYTHIEIIHRIRGHHIDPNAVARAIELSEEKYCSVSAMLKGTTHLTSRFDIAEDTREQSSASD